MQMINKILWGIATIFLMGGGIYFTFRLKGVQFRFRDMIHSFHKESGEQISPFKTLTIATAARIGVGSLAGVALAIYMGGVGTIFWLWVSTLLVAANAFCESCLGMLYREKDGEFYNGGPAFYIKKGLGRQKLAMVYALLVLVAYILGFLTIQSNTMTKSLETLISIPNVAIGVVIALISFIVIYRGIGGIADFTAKLVPIMGIGYLLVTLFVILKNISLLPSIFYTIFSEAFTGRAVSAGVLGTALIGIQRGIFSNEAGIGTGAIASSTSDSNHPVGQGLVQVVGIYFTSLVICTATAFFILTSNYQNLVLDQVNGIEITRYAFAYHLGSLGEWFLVILILLFAFSTIITGYYYGESNLKFLVPNLSKKNVFLLKLVTVLLLVWGSVASSTFLWNLVDILVALLAIINVYALIALRSDIFASYHKYVQSHKKGQRGNSMIVKRKKGRIIEKKE